MLIKLLKPLVICWIILLFSIQLSGINFEKLSQEELEKILQTSSEKQRIEILVFLSSRELGKNLGSATGRAKEALSLAMNEKNERLLSPVNFTLAAAQYHSAKYEEALFRADEALRWATRNNDLKLIADTFQLKGAIYENLGKYDQALDNLRKSLEIALKGKFSGAKDVAANCFNSIGTIYFRLKEVDRSLEYFQKAYQVMIEVKNFQRAAGFLNNIGVF